MKKIHAVVLSALFIGISPIYSSCVRNASFRPAPAAPADSLTLLRGDLDRIFADPNFANAQWGVEILSLDRSEPIYQLNPDRLCMPASNDKLLAAAVALVRLGPDFRYETKVLTDGSIVAGTLKGSLLVVGSGDPSNAPRFQAADPFQIFRNWASRLKEKEIRRIEGDLLGDEAAFEKTVHGNGWEWDDLAYGYAAPVSALQFNENVAVIEIAPGASEGNAAILKIGPLENYLTVKNNITTAAAGTEARIEAVRGDAAESVVMTGAVPLRSPPVTQTVAVQFPTNYYLEALKFVLQQEGIDVSSCRIAAVRGWKASSLNLLWTQASPALAEIIKPLLKVSQNLYAETLVRTLGLRFQGVGSFADGKEVVEAALNDMAIERGMYSYADGSGLSRHNLITPDLLVRVLQFMSRHPYFQQFYQSLPIAGVDGTLATRMKRTKAENNVRAKTGSIANVRSLSGYVHTADGELVAFSIIANNFLVSGKAAEYVQDSVAELLANFRRK